MKTLLLTFVLVSSAAFAHEIKGTLILKGTAKTKLTVNGVEAKCEAKVDEVKNTMTEDSHGNPAYRVWIKMKLETGWNVPSEQRLGYNNTIRFVNIHPEGDGTAVSDTNYVAENEARSTMRIDENGRIKTIVFPVGAQLMTCQF